MFSIAIRRNGSYRPFSCCMCLPLCKKGTRIVMCQHFYTQMTQQWSMGAKTVGHGPWMHTNVYSEPWKALIGSSVPINERTYIYEWYQIRCRVCQDVFRIYQTELEDHTNRPTLRYGITYQFEYWLQSVFRHAWSNVEVTVCLMSVLTLTKPPVN